MSTRNNNGNATVSFTDGQRVNALWSDGETYGGSVVKTAKGNITVEFDDGETHTYTAAAVKRGDVTISKRGRRSLHEEMTPAEIEKEVKDLLAELKTSDDPEDKKRIRRALRRRGHTGGLGVRATTKKSTTKKSTAKKTAKKSTTKKSTTKKS